MKDGQKVNECLRKCLKIASQCVDTNAQFELHVEILNYYMFFYEAKNDQVSILKIMAQIYRNWNENPNLRLF